MPDGGGIDIIVGAKEIAALLGWPERRVRHVVEMRAKGKCEMPIWHEPGLGIVTTRTALKAWISARLSAPVDKAPPSEAA